MCVGVEVVLVENINVLERFKLMTRAPLIFIATYEVSVIVVQLVTTAEVSAEDVVVDVTVVVTVCNGPDSDTTDTTLLMDSGMLVTVVVICFEKDV